MYAACQVSLAPMRAHPSDKSEMVSQLLFGETVEISESKDGWRHVVCAWDGFVGWVDAKQLRPLTPSEYDDYREHSSVNLSLVEGLMAAVLKFEQHERQFDPAAARRQALRFSRENCLDALKRTLTGTAKRGKGAQAA